MGHQDGHVQKLDNKTVEAIREIGQCIGKWAYLRNVPIPDHDPMGEGTGAEATQQLGNLGEALKAAGVSIESEIPGGVNSPEAEIVEAALAASLPEAPIG